MFPWGLFHKESCPVWRQSHSRECHVSFWEFCCSFINLETEDDYFSLHGNLFFQCSKLSQASGERHFIVSWLACISVVFQEILIAYEGLKQKIWMTFLCACCLLKPHWIFYWMIFKTWAYLIFSLRVLCGERIEETDTVYGFCFSCSTLLHSLLGWQYLEGPHRSKNSLPWF